MEQLLSTKFYIPPTRRKLVSRPRLVKRINAGLHRKLTLISAPAGFGKTTLVSEWVERTHSDDQNKFSTAWLSLDEHDNDLVRFLSYFIAAFKNAEGVAETLGDGALSMLQSPQPPPTETILTILINDITSISGKIILVLDDYHLISQTDIDDALTFLLEHLPTQLHLIIVTRVDPQLPLARLRARSQLNEMRATDLRFSSSEASDFLNEAMGLTLSEEDITALEIRTEGWIAGLQLAAISIRGSKDHSSLINSFTGSHRLVLDYLVEEVLNQQSESVQTFLLQTSILNRLSASLCDAVTGQDNGQETLEMLERANLFVVPMDNKRRWYRYHHLFTDVLKAHLVGQQPDQVAILHQRASEWYEGKDIPSDAIRHALAAADFERAADLAELTWPAWSESDATQCITWFGWVKTLPDELVCARPVLSVAFAQAYLIAGKLEDAGVKLLEAERWLEPTTDMHSPLKAATTKKVFVNEEQFRDLPISFAIARAYYSQAIGDVPGTIKYGQQALDILPEGTHPFRAQANNLLGLAYWASGDLDAAHHKITDCLAGNIYAMIHGAFMLADIKLTQGHLHEAVSTCERALRLAVEHSEPMLLGAEEVYICISNLHREQGDLEAAAQDLARSEMLGEQVALPDWQYRWHIAQAQLKQSQGVLSKALDLLDEAERLYIRTALPNVRPIVAMRARVWVAQGRLAEALGWARERGLSADDELSFLREFEHITLARVLIAQYQSNQEEVSISEATTLLKRLLKAAEEGGRMGSVIEILALQALADDAQGDIRQALVSLERALTLAEPEGYVRIFVDEGTPMAKLLNEALDRGIAKEYVSRLLAAFQISTPQPKSPAIAQIPIENTIEPLTDRECEVLQLIAEGLTNQEIASRLYLSMNTIKVHTRNIFGKLNVNNRMQAVARAKALGLLSPD